MHRKPVIAIAGLSCETSAFSPARSDYNAFHVLRGDEVFSKYDFIRPGSSLGDAAEWKCALTGKAIPGGIVTRAAFEAYSTEILDRLTEIKNAQTIDGFWFDIHGAMCVEDLDDSEAELLRRIRGVIGQQPVVSASMDLHGNVSRQLAHQSDLITCFRTAPHIDVSETRERACKNLVDLLEERFATDGAPKLPLKAWIPVPILLAGEQTSTRLNPAKSLYAEVPKVESVRGVIDAAIWVGYAWADEPRDRAVVVVTGWDKNAIKQGAERLAKLFWDAHADFDFVAPTGTLEECLVAALSSKARPYFISDSGDNPTAGGAGDVTWTLTKLLEDTRFQSSSGPKLIYASIPGPRAVHTAVEAGTGSTITVTAGAEVDDVHAGPVTMTGRVHAIKHGDRDAKIEVVLQVGSVFVIMTELRKPYHHESDFTELSLQPREADIVMVKIGYLEPELYAMAADWMMALTPGGVDQDLKRLGHHRIHRPMWPFDTDFSKPPNLEARFISPSNEPLDGHDE